MMASTPPIEVTDHLMQLYAAYRHTTDNDAKGLFFAVDCHQICRPMPSYAAQDRATIVRYLHESSGLSIDGASVKEEKKAKKSFATIRPLRPDEFEFGTDEQVQPAGFATVDDVKKRALNQDWVGMRVDLWDEEEGEEEKGEQTKDGRPQGTLIKVQYWWGKQKKEDGTENGWMQVLHDIMYIGPLDGTQGKEGEFIEDA